MKITNKTLVESVEGVRELSRLLLPVRASFNAGKAVNAVQFHLNAYEDERRKLIEKYGERDAEQKLVELSPGQTKIEDFAAFSADMAVLNAIEIDVDTPPISISSMGDTAQISIGAMASISWLIVGDA